MSFFHNKSNFFFSIAKKVYLLLKLELDNTIIYSIKSNLKFEDVHISDLIFYFLFCIDNKFVMLSLFHLWERSRWEAGELIASKYMDLVPP